jgi:hypothetical protein
MNTVSAPRSLREALAYLQLRPRVEISLGRSWHLRTLSAIFKQQVQGGWEFLIYNGPQSEIGRSLLVRFDGGNTAWETTVDFTPFGLTVRRMGTEVKVVYLDRQPPPMPPPLAAA